LKFIVIGEWMLKKKERINTYMQTIDYNRSFFRQNITKKRNVSIDLHSMKWISRWTIRT